MPTLLLDFPIQTADGKEHTFSRFTTKGEDVVVYYRTGGQPVLPVSVDAMLVFHDHEDANAQWRVATSATYSDYDYAIWVYVDFVVFERKRGRSITVKRPSIFQEVDGKVHLLWSNYHWATIDQKGGCRIRYHKAQLLSIRDEMRAEYEKLPYALYGGETE